MRATEYFGRACDPRTLTVRQLMEDAVVTVSPKATGLTIAQILSERNFGSVPVVEDDRTLVGLVSEFDLLRVMDEDKDLRQVTAVEMMTRNVVTATEDMPAQELVHLLQVSHLIRVPVVNGTTLVGIVARRDIVFGYVKATAKYWP